MQVSIRALALLAPDRHNAPSPTPGARTESQRAGLAAREAGVGAHGLDGMLIRGDLEGWTACQSGKSGPSSHPLSCSSTERAEPSMACRPDGRCSLLPAHFPSAAAWHCVLQHYMRTAKWLRGRRSACQGYAQSAAISRELNSSCMRLLQVGNR